MTSESDVKTEGKDERGLRDGFVFVGTIIALLLVMSLTPNRLMQAGGAVVIGVAGYFIPPRPKKSFLLYAAALLLLAGCWAIGDRISGVLRHIFWTH
jgi:hypothetical protein